MRFILKRDTKGLFRFAWLQSAAGRTLVDKFNTDTGRKDSIVLISGGKIYTRSDAVLLIMKMLGGGWSLFYIFRVIPKGWRDAIYDFIARKRYGWFGKKIRCELPVKPDFRDRFLDVPQDSSQEDL